MAKIQVVFEVNEDILLNEVNDLGVESLSEAISQELGWVADSGIFVESWEFIEKQNKTHKALYIKGVGSFF